jgi:hypothetical protein
MYIPKKVRITNQTDEETLDDREDEEVLKQEEAKKAYMK